MGCNASKLDESYAQHPPLLEEHVYQLNLPAPPINGFDSFMKLEWCRDLKEEREEQEMAEKQSKKKKTSIPPPPKKYYLCLRCKYEPYEENKTINLQKAEKPWQALPKWQDPDFMEDILANGPFFQNDAFILEHVPTAIRPPEDYAYTEQFKRAFLHHNGIKPTAEQIEQQEVRVAKIIWKELQKYQTNDNRDAKGRDRSRTVKKLQDVLTSLQLDAKILTAAQAEVETEMKEEEEKQKEIEAKAKEKEERAAKKQKDDKKSEEKTEEEKVREKEEGQAKS